MMISGGGSDAENGEDIHSMSFESQISNTEVSTTPSFRTETTVILTPVVPNASVTVRKNSLPINGSYSKLNLVAKKPLLDISLNSSHFSSEHGNVLSQSSLPDGLLSGICDMNRHKQSIQLAQVDCKDQSRAPPNSQASTCCNNSLFEVDDRFGVFASTPTPSQSSQCAHKLNLSHEDKLDRILVLMEEHSTEIKSLRADLTSFQSSITENLHVCSDRIDSIENRLSSELNSAKIKSDESLARLDADLQQKIQAKFQECLDDQYDIYDYVDDRINEKFCELDDQVAPRLISAGIEIDAKINSCNDRLSESVESGVRKFLTSTAGREFLSPLCNSQSTLSEARQLIDDAYTQLRTEVLGIITQLKFMQCHFMQELQKLKENDSFETVTSHNPTIQIVSKKIDKLAVWIESLQNQLNAKSKIISTLDLKSRKDNLIVEGILEEPDEDLFYTIGSLFVQFVQGFDCNSIESVFRLGKPNSGEKTARKILVSFNSTYAREAVLSRAGHIAKAGPPGGRIYVNEDVPEDVKRRRADVYKYVNYMNENGHTITQKGDSVILNNTHYVYEELSLMPKGMSLADSRTIVKNGVIAFQSPHSPLSNLYIAPIKHNGITYQSAEYAFQHTKAVHCKNHVLARAILSEPNPFDAMATGKRVDVTNEWADCQLNEMSKILQAKLEQVPAFYSALKSSDRHHLVENTRSLFWGAGTPYNSEKIFDRSYPGKNKLGFLLEEIRSKF